ncbi:YezD family protein [Bacillus megaterium]|nr:YezD family protein [Priestia megaterium]
MASITQEKLDYIVKLLTEINYGSVLITLHDGQITQVDSTEKNRFLAKSKVASHE